MAQMRQTLMERTRDLLDNQEKRCADARGQSMPKIAEILGISYYWLRKFKSGEVDDPSVNTVEKLYEYLSGKKLLPETKQSA